MSRTLASLFALFVFTVCMGGCGSPATGGTETGNTTAVSISVIGYQSSQLAALALPALAVTGLDITTAQVVLDHLTFRPFSACNATGEDNGSREIRIDGPFVVDLLNFQILSGLENLRIATGRYCQIGLTFKNMNFSIFIEGTRSDGTRFQMTAAIDDEFNLENAAGFLIEASTTASVFFLAFDLDRWFQGVDLSDPSIEVSIDAEGNPVILINETKNTSVQQNIKENIENSADLFKDADNDNHLDSEEEDSLASGSSTP